jgi:hypothetical protein
MIAMMIPSESWVARWQRVSMCSLLLNLFFSLHMLSFSPSIKSLHVNEYFLSSVPTTYQIKISTYIKYLQPNLHLECMR